MSNRKEQEKLLQMINQNQGIIFKICNSYCHNKNEREDLAQEIIYQLLKSAHSFNEQYKFSTWMYRVALNVAISFYRKNKTKELIPFAESRSDRQDYNDHSVELEDNISILQGFINELKELDKALMILYLETRSYKEISEILGITETNVATKINRIKNSLKQKFSEINQ
ncbi:MAG TPA: sigma-70 family RNA polymerase sigma factor [Hanamia sp.]|nr:sigma-70 family RNA polymerase sigma factor [Hanamia sp.]